MDIFELLMTPVSRLARMSAAAVIALLGLAVVLAGLAVTGLGVGLACVGQWLSQAAMRLKRGI